MTKRHQDEVDFLKSLRNNPQSLIKPEINPKADIVRDSDDQVNIFKLLLDASEDNIIGQDRHCDKIMAYISYYVQSGNILRATSQVRLLADTPKMQNFVDIALCMILKNENADKLLAPYAVGELFAWLITERLLKYGTFYPRFHKFIKQRVSIEAKYKHFMEAVTEFLVSLLITLGPYHKKYVLCGMLCAFQRSGEGQDLIALIMKRVSELHSPEIAGKLWEAAKFEWSDFLQPGMSEEEFIEIKKLDFLYSDINPNADIDRGLIEDDQVNFFKLLLDAAEDSSTCEDLNYEEVMAIISDYVDSRNILYATNQIKTLPDPPKMDKFVDIALCTLLKNQYEDKVTVPFAVGELFAWLIAERILTYATLYPRFHKFLKQRASIEAKYKHFMEAVTEFLVSLLISLSQYYKKYVLCGMLGAFQRSGEAQDLMALAMKRISELHSPDIAANLWEFSKFQWSDFLQPGMSEREFIKINKLDFLNSYTSDSKLEEHSVRPKTGYNVKPEHQICHSTSSRANHLTLTEKLVDGPEMKLKFENLLWAYFKDRDLEKFRFQIEPFVKHPKSVEFFVRYAIETGFNLGKEFYRLISELLSYLKAFRLVTEKQRLEALRSVIGEREATFKDKDAITKQIGFFMVNSKVKSTSLWASQKMDSSRIINEKSDACLDQRASNGDCNEDPKAKSSPTLVPFVSSQKHGDPNLTRGPKPLLDVKHLLNGDNLKPRLHSKTAVEPNEDATDEEPVKQFRCILNQLSSQKYDIFEEEMKKLTVDTKEKLQMVLELIYDKAINEPDFSGAYANLCKQLSGTLRVVNVEENEKVKFHQLLLTRCQKEFERKMYESIFIEGRRKKFDETRDPQRKKLLFDELDDEKQRVLKERLGNIKFIGELYRLDMLKYNFILGCIDKLLSDEQEESLECLCTLLRTTGAKLELCPKYQKQVVNLGRDPLAPCFSKLLAIVNAKKTSARVRFMIQDILDMRAKQWRPNKIQNEVNPRNLEKSQSVCGNYVATTNEGHAIKKVGEENSRTCFSAIFTQGKMVDQSDSVEIRKTLESTSLVPFVPSPMVAKIEGKTRDHEKDVKIVGTLTDYLTDNEAIKHFHFCYDQSNSAQFVSTAVNHAIDNELSRNALGKLLLHFLIHHIIKPEHFTKGWLNTLSCAKDSHQGAFEFLELIASLLDELHNCNCPGSHMSISESKKVFAYILDHVKLDMSSMKSYLMAALK